MYIQGKMFLHDIAADKDNMVFTHVQDTTPILREVAFLRNNSDRGFTQGRTLQHVGKIPDAIYFSHPEFYGEGGAEAMMKWLKSEEGRPYRITDGI